MDRKLQRLGIKQKGDIRCLIEQNNNLPYDQRDSKLSALYDVIVQYNATAPDRTTIIGAKDAYACLSPKMRDLEKEEIWVVFMNKANRVLQVKKMFEGGFDSSIIDNRVVIREALLIKATGLIIAHNHPSGIAKPSKQDITMTEKLKKAAEVCDITLHDHIIIAGGKFYSFADEGEF